MTCTLAVDILLLLESDSAYYQDTKSIYLRLVYSADLQLIL